MVTMSYTMTPTKTKLNAYDMLLSNLTKLGPTTLCSMRGVSSLIISGHILHPFNTMQSLMEGTSFYDFQFHKIDDI